MSHATTVSQETRPAKRTPTVGMRGRRRARAALDSSVNRGNWLFLSPTILGVLAFIVAPLGYAAYLSLRDFDLQRATNHFIGFRNYARVLSNADPGFVAALFRTLLYVVVVIALDFIVAMTQGLLIFGMKPRAAKFWRAVFMLPILIIPTASAVFWRTIMYSPNGQFLRVLGLSHVLHPPLGDPKLAFWAIIITVIWAWSPWVFLLLSAGLDRIPRDVIEAAMVDGASYFERLRLIIMPLMKPTIFVTLSFKAIDSFLSFPFVWVMTQGGPGGSTHLLSTYIYRTAFSLLNYGLGSAMSIVMLVISAVLSTVVVLFWNRSYGKEA